MKQLLIVSKKKVFRPYGENVLIQYNGDRESNLAEWVSARFGMSVVKVDKIDNSEIVVLTAVEKQHLTNGEYISLSKTIERLGQENKQLQNYLNNLRIEMDIQLEYGVKDGKIVNISELPTEHKGLQCECTCPGCGGRLIARKGNKKKHHFAHYNEPCNLVTAQQTALHMLAKEILEEEKLFMFPGYSVTYDEIEHDTDNRPYNYYQMPRLQYRDAYRAQCDSVVLEKRISNFVPDIIVNVKGKVCLVEIAVTHFVDEEKQKKIQDLGLPLVEVDLSSLHGQSPSREVIRDVLVNQTSSKTWIYNPLRKEALKWAQSQYQRINDEMLEAEEKRQEKKRKQAEQAQKKRTDATEIIKDLLQPENYAEALSALRSDDAFGEVLKNFSFRKELNGKLPFFMDIPITGEMVFACDRRIWQAAIFDKFVYNRTKGSDGYTRYSNDKIHACIKNHMPYVPIDWRLSYKVRLAFSDGWRRFTLLYDVVEKYIEYLIYLGFLEKVDYKAGIVTTTHSLTPPREKEAKLLESAIQRSNRCNPFIDDEIESTLYPSEVELNVYSYFGEDTPVIQNAPMTESMIKGIENRQGMEYDIGFEDASKYNFGSSEPFFDSFGKRWVVCKYCNRIKREDEMQSYGGRGTENKGICNECSKR